MTVADLRAWQAAVGFTYESAAEALGMSRSGYAKLVTGACRQRPAHGAGLCSHCGGAASMDATASCLHSSRTLLKGLGTLSYDVTHAALNPQAKIVLTTPTALHNNAFMLPGMHSMGLKMVFFKNTIDLYKFFNPTLSARSGPSQSTKAPRRIRAGAFSLEMSSIIVQNTPCRYRASLETFYRADSWPNMWTSTSAALRAPVWPSACAPCLRDGRGA
ncbi:helix-turn-helix domain-containing protein [Verminephrobacter eiseniae]|uniref:helix-turn-helix domain-containing protein n=1 Tax=Verminephrobacter eiseniae TaxID=364317 RepID=UPI0005A50906|nr:helix-turn-helix transcriptional regulator [Verminephrobacter eiseniae]